jgi:hypothetical protein
LQRARDIHQHEQQAAHGSPTMSRLPESGS